MRKNRDVKHATTKAKSNYLVSQRNYHISKLVSGDVLAIGMEKKQGVMNEPMFLGLQLLEISK